MDAKVSVTSSDSGALEIVVARLNTARVASGRHLSSFQFDEVLHTRRAAALFFLPLELLTTEEEVVVSRCDASERVTKGHPGVSPLRRHVRRIYTNQRPASLHVT